MQKQRFSIEADTKLQATMRDAAAAMVQRTRAAWLGNGDLSQVQTGKLRPPGRTDRMRAAGRYLKLLATEL